MTIKNWHCVAIVAIATFVTFWIISSPARPAEVCTILICCKTYPLRETYFGSSCESVLGFRIPSYEPRSERRDAVPMEAFHPSYPSRWSIPLNR